MTHDIVVRLKVSVVLQVPYITPFVYIGCLTTFLVLFFVVLSRRITVEHSFFVSVSLRRYIAAAHQGYSDKAAYKQTNKKTDHFSSPS